MMPYDLPAGKLTDSSGNVTIDFPALASDWLIRWLTLENETTNATRTSGALVQVRRLTQGGGSQLIGWGPGIPFQGGPIVIPRGTSLRLVVTSGPTSTPLSAFAQGEIAEADDASPLANLVQVAQAQGTNFSGLHADLPDTDVAGHVGALLATDVAPNTRWEMSSAQADQLLGYVSGETVPGRITISTDNLSLQSPRPVASSSPSIQLLSALAGSVQIELDTNDVILGTGFQARGFCAAQGYADAGGATHAIGEGVTYGAVSTLTNVPSSITLSTVGSDANVASVTTASIGLRGFRFAAVPTGAGQTRADRTYVTVGN